MAPVLDFLIPHSITELHTSLCYSLVFLGVSSFLLLVSRTAPYGRYSRAGWGALMNAKVAWVVQESPALLVPLVIYVRHGSSSFLQHPFSQRTWLAAAFLIHYIYRTAVFPSLIRGGKQTPVSVCGLAFLFCCWNGFLQGWFLAEEMQPDAALTSRVLLGLAVWAIGLFNVIKADLILINLRKPGDTGYKIPHGGMFRFVSAANYFAEILEWLGWAIAAWSLSGATFAFFTFCNLAPRGAEHHRWYRSKFEDYPRNRKAVIPFLW